MDSTVSCFTHFERRTKSMTITGFTNYVLSAFKLEFYQIRTMTSSVFSGFRSSLPFLVLFVASYTLAKPRNNANGDPVGSIATKQYNNVYLYTAPNHEIKTILQEMKKQLTQLQDDILKEKKTTVKGKICFRVETWILLIFRNIWDG